MDFAPGRMCRLLATGLALVVLSSVAALGVPPRAEAAETIYWDNFSSTPATIAVSNLDGTGGGPLNLSGVTLKEPEGMTFDPLTGRLYVASSGSGVGGKGEIQWVSVDGTGAGVLSTPGVEVNEPAGVDIDPATRTIYWANFSGGPQGKGSIAYARLDGSGGGPLNTAGVAVENPFRLAVDPVNRKLYWGNHSNSIAFANLDNTGSGGTLNVTGAPSPTTIYALAVDAAVGRVYWLESSPANKHLSYASVAGGGGGELSLTGLPFNEPFGLAIDPTAERVYWMNSRNETNRNSAIGFANITAGGGGGITPATAPVEVPQDPVILKSPVGSGAPAIARSSKVRSMLSCSTGTWGGDFPGSFVYQSPRSYAYQWSRNRKPVAGATGATFSAKSAGNYACTVTASNQAGSAAQTSAVVKVKPAKLKLTTKKEVRAAAGQTVKIHLKAANQGDLKAKAARVCVKLPKSAKGALKAPKCKSLGGLRAGAKKSVTLKINVLPPASGSYEVSFQAKGTAGKAARTTIVVG